MPIVPDHWSVERIKHLAECLDGQRVPLNAEQRSVRGGDVPYWGANSVVDYVDAALFDEPLVLIGEDGAPFFDSTRQVAFYSEGPIWPNNHVHVLRPTERESGRFLAYALNATSYADFVEGSTREKLTQGRMSEIPVAWPERAERLAIVAFLDHETARIDALIAEQERLIELLQEKRQAVILRAVTKGLNANVQTKSTGVEWLGDVPMHWEVVRLGALYAERNVAGSDELPILTVSIHTGVSDDEIDENDVDRKVVRSDDRSKYKAVQPGDLVYNMMRAWQGGMGAVSVVGQVSPAYVVAQPRRPILTEFVEYLLRTPQGVEEMRRHSRGITDFRLRLYWDEFKQISICLPSAREQVEIVDTIREAVARFDALAREAGHAVELLSEHRSALISAAVTGQIDVRGLVPEAAA